MATSAAVSSSPLFEQFYNFPPFFTLQPTPTTKSRQLDLWTKFLQSHCKSSNQFILTRSESIFTNDELKRSLSNDFVTELFNHMIESGNGVPNASAGSTAASPSSPKHSKGKGVSSQPYHESIIILFISKEKWFEKLYDYAKRNGLQNGGIATAFEILNDEEFNGMDSKVLDILLRGMMRETRKCEVMEGADGGTEGVKFF